MHPHAPNRAANSSSISFDIALTDLSVANVVGST
jgi:hypothetical protein